MRYFSNSTWVFTPLQLKINPKLIVMKKYEILYFI